MLRYSLTLLAGVCYFISSAQYSVSGTVKLRKGDPVAYASLWLEGTGFRAQTDAGGHFIFSNVEDGKYLLKCTSVGMKEYSTDLIIAGHSLVLELITEESSGSADEGSVLKGKELETLLIEATQANEKTPMTFSNIRKKNIEPLNNGQDIPYLLRYTPSMVVTSDAGNGVGYTGLWIRGSDPSRINVTVNGIPLNDPESQQVFWVNMPDFASSTSNIQIQRGVGTSANGAASFGGSIKLESENANPVAFAKLNNSYGSFNTQKNNVQFGSGLLGDHFVLEGRLSRIHSDGYTDRATSDLLSHYLSASYLTARTKIVLTNFGGKETTYQSWYGTPAEKLEGAVDNDLLAFAARNSLTEHQTENLLNSGRTFNFYTYENQVDHYGQDHYQLHLRHSFLDNLYVNLAGHYTRGKGYYEEYKEKAALSDYGLPDLFINNGQVFSDGLDENGNPVNAQYASSFTNGDIEVQQAVVTDLNGDSIVDVNGNYLLDVDARISRSDIVRRRWLDNHFYGGVGSLIYSAEKWLFTLGGAYNEYRGKHYGELTWMQYSGDAMPGDHYYSGKSLKRDGNAYLKTVFSPLRNLDIYADLQIRRVSYLTTGMDNDLRNYDVNDNLNFFNPKAGITWRIKSGQRIYASAAVGNKEPNRNDYVDSPSGARPLPEQMIDFEAGYQMSTRKCFFNANIYLMEYKNQLVLTGELNDVGALLRTNVRESSRRGIELEGGWQWTKWLNIYGNLTLSRNRINHFNEVLYDYTNGFDVITIGHDQTDIAFSPSMIGSGGVTFTLWQTVNGGSGKDAQEQDLGFTLLYKYVGKQYLDNTSNEDLTIGAYQVVDARLTYTLKKGALSEMRLHFWVNNLLDREYVSNGYTYSYIYSNRVTERFYYPQAGRNIMLGLNLGF